MKTGPNPVEEHPKDAFSKSLIIADDHAFTTSGMSQTLADTGKFHIIGTAGNGIQAISMIRSLKPDCALLDYAMPGANGLEVFIEASRWSPQTRFAIVTGNTNAGTLCQLIDAGVHGLFLKEFAISEVCEGLTRVSNGETVISKAVREIAGHGKSLPPLTARETEVLQAIARGKSNPEIAGDLGVSPKTVDSHRTSLMRKMEVHSTATLLVRAMREGLVDTDSPV